MALIVDVGATNAQASVYGIQMRASMPVGFGMDSIEMFTKTVIAEK